MSDRLFYPRAAGEILRVLGGTGMWSGVDGQGRTGIRVEYLALRAKDRELVADLYIADDDLAVLLAQW